MYISTGSSVKGGGIRRYEKRLWATVISAAVAFAIIALFTPTAAQAHDFEPERQLLVQVFPDRVDVMIEYLEAPGERSAMFSAYFFFGLDPRADEAFEELAKKAILPRMLDGLQFEIFGENPKATDPEVRIRHIEGRIMAAALVSYELPELAEDNRRLFVLRAADRSFLPTRTIIYAGGGLVRIDADRDMDDIAPAEFFELTAGARWRAAFAYPEK